MSEFKSRKQSKNNIINTDSSHNNRKSSIDDKQNKQDSNCFNLAHFRNKVINELDLKLKEEYQDNQTCQSSKENSNLYEYNRLYKLFIDNQYNDRLISIINSIINEPNNSLEFLKNSLPLHKVLAGIVKKFMLTENELVYFSIYLDKLGWMNEEYEFDTYLQIIAYTVKLYLNTNTSAITYYLQTTHTEFENIYSNFLKNQESYCESLNITPREVNKKHKELTKPINIYCKQNYLDLNYIVDEVVAMSLPYSETKKEKEKDRIIDDLSVTNFHLMQSKPIVGKQSSKLTISDVAEISTNNNQKKNNANVNQNTNLLMISNPFLSKATIENYNNYENIKKNEPNLKESDKKSFTQYSESNMTKSKSQNSIITDLSKLKTENIFNNNSLTSNALLKNLINAKSFEQDMTKFNNEIPRKLK